MSQTVMKNLVGEFGAAIGIPDLDTDEDHRCNLMFDEVAVSLELSGDGESLFVYSLLGRVPDRETDSFHAALLHANHLLEGTRGSTLSVDPQSRDVVLIREERLDTLRLPRLESILEDFVNVAEHWMAQLAGGSVERVPDQQATDAELPGGGMMRV